MSEPNQPDGVWTRWWAGRRAVFVSGTAGDTRRYRCDYQAEQLRLLGATADVVADAPDLDLEGAAKVREAACVVLHRLEWDERVERLVALAREQGVPTIFDTDDLTFEAEAAAAVSWFIDLDESGRRASFERQRKTLVACSAATASTGFLARRIRPLNRRIAVVPNAVGAEMIREAEAALAAREGVTPPPTTTIVYMSGTPTHDRDVLEAADALVQTLTTHVDARLLVVGYLDLDSRFDSLGAHVERLPFQPRERLPGILARVDLNIAPLERGNAFAQAKSCVKYLEAATVGTPTISSAAPDFVRAIADGDNGILAHSQAHWVRALERLVSDRDYRASIGRRAYADVRARHTTAARAPSFGRSLALATIASAAEAGTSGRAGGRLVAAAPRL